MKQENKSNCYISVYVSLSTYEYKYVFELKLNKPGKLARKTGPGDTAVEAEEVGKNAYPKLMRFLVCTSSMKQHEMLHKM